jgi:hypothetical protein
MRVQYASDLHLECFASNAKRLRVLHELIEPAVLRPGTFKREKPDLLVLAGDIVQVSAVDEFELDSILLTAAELADQVVYVMGNHEFYQSSPTIVMDRLRAACAETGVTLLEPGKGLELPGSNGADGAGDGAGGRRVLGGTMWFRQPTTPVERQYLGSLEKHMNDFHMIQNFKPWVYNQNARLLEWLDQEMSEGDIVVTHHLPSMQSVALRYKTDPLNAFFVCDVEELIERRRPALWVHGHTHTACDYTLGVDYKHGRDVFARVVCNPRGYPNERGTGYNPHAMVEL